MLQCYMILPLHFFADSQKLRTSFKKKSCEKQNTKNIDISNIDISQKKFTSLSRQHQMSERIVGSCSHNSAGFFGLQVTSSDAGSNNNNNNSMDSLRHRRFNL